MWWSFLGTVSKTEIIAQNTSSVVLSFIAFKTSSCEVHKLYWRLTGVFFLFLNLAWGKRGKAWWHEPRDSFSHHIFTVSRWPCRLCQCPKVCVAGCSRSSRTERTQKFTQGIKRLCHRWGSSTLARLQTLNAIRCHCGILKFIYWIAYSIFLILFVQSLQEKGKKITASWDI